jgi:hypothetical protein
MNYLLRSLYSCVFTVCLFLWISVPVNAQSALEVTITSFTNVTCHGAANGTASASVSNNAGPVTFSWGPNVAIYTATATGLDSGNYYVIARDTVTSDTAFVYINQPRRLLVTLSRSKLNCNGDSNGTASVTVSGGTVPYTYAWGTYPVSSTPSINGLKAGNYSLTVSDSNACSKDTSVLIVQPGGYITISDVGCNKKLTTHDSLGHGPYSWAWNTSPSQTASSIVVNTSGTYSVIVTDTSTCFHIDTISVIVPIPPPVPIVTLVGASLVCNVTPPCQWMLLGVPIAGVTDSLFQPSVNGVYTVYAGTPPCISVSAPYTLTSAGIENYSEELNYFSFSPNPSTGDIIVKFTPGIPAKGSVIRINDVCGRELMKEVSLPMPDQPLHLNLGNFPDGIYFLSVHDAEGDFHGCRKVVIRH